PSRCGIKADAQLREAEYPLLGRAASSAGPSALRLECASDVTVMGRGTGRALRWGQLFYNRTCPAGICVEITMDWHHLRSGIPLFGTMTVEQLVEQGTFRLRFRSYAHDTRDSQTTDFVRLF